MLAVQWVGVTCHQAREHGGMDKRLRTILLVLAYAGLLTTASAVFVEAAMALVKGQTALGFWLLFVTWVHLLSTARTTWLGWSVTRRGSMEA